MLSRVCCVVCVRAVDKQSGVCCSVVFALLCCSVSCVCAPLKMTLVKESVREVRLCLFVSVCVCVCLCESDNILCNLAFFYISLAIMCIYIFLFFLLLYYFVAVLGHA